MNKVLNAPQSDTMYVKLKFRHYFGVVGTFGSRQMDSLGNLVPVGDHGQGNSIFPIAQNILSDRYTYGASTTPRSYWLVAIPEPVDIEAAFNSNRSPLIVLYRGIHDTYGEQTLLNATIASVYQYHYDTGLAPGKFCILVDQIWHKFRGHEQDLIPLGNRKQDGKHINKAELILKVVWTATPPGFSGNQDKGYLDLIKSENAFNYTQEVNIGGFRLERFRFLDRLLNTQSHLPLSDELPMSVIAHIRDDIFASDIVEKLLMDRTQTNWNTFPNIAQAIFVPTVYHRNTFESAKLVLLWTDPTVIEGTHKDLFDKQSNRQVAGLDDIGSYASLVPGDIYVVSNPDGRARYAQLGKAYAAENDENCTAVTTTPRNKKPGCLPLQKEP